MKNKLYLFCLLFSLFGFSQMASAIIISAVPNTSTISTSDQLVVELIASDLNNEYIALYDFGLDYDDSILSLSSVVFGAGLGNADGLSITDVISSTLGTVIFAETSFFFTDLTAYQDGVSDFLLATVVFDSTGAGNSDLSLFGNLGGIGGGFVADTTGTAIASTSVDSFVSVPEPSAIFLFGIGALVFAGTGGFKLRRISL